MIRGPLVSGIVGTVLVAAVALGLFAVWQGSETCPDGPQRVLLGWSYARDRLHPRWSGCFGTVDRRDSKALLLTPLQMRGALASFESATTQQTRGATGDFAVALALAGDSLRAIATMKA